MPIGFIDPGFVGQLTMEIIGGSFPILLHSGDRIFHVVFAMMKQITKNAYTGKYQNQKGVALPIFPEWHVHRGFSMGN
jgi:dCTP deaminase